MSPTLKSTTESPLSGIVERLAGRGPAALGVLRRAALDHFLGTEDPSRSLHLWRYTDPARLGPGSLVPGGDARPDGSDPRPAAARRRPGILPATATGEDGEPLPRGVEVRDLEAALHDGAAAGFASLSGAAPGKFEALNLALFPAGSLVRIARGARPERAVSLVHRVGAAGTLSCPRTLVVVEEGAEAALIEEFEGEAGPDGHGEDGGDGLIHSVTEVLLGPGARLVHTVVNTLGARARGSLVQRARLERGAALTSVGVSLGGALVKTEASAVLAGEGARSEVLGAVFGAARQHIDSHYFQDHQAPRTTSDLLVRVALAGRARASYTGRLRIVMDAPGCEARQENRNLLLSAESRADSIPELEILTHEVQCSHAAATGPVDRDMLFYLRSRGLDARDAERMIVLGFLEPVFARIPGEALPGALRELAVRRLSDDGGNRR